MLTCIACNINLKPLFQESFSGELLEIVEIKVQLCLVLDFLTETVKDAMTNFEQMKLHYSIVLARHIGVTYKDWFKVSFDSFCAFCAIDMHTVIANVWKNQDEPNYKQKKLEVSYRRTGCFSAA